MNKGYMGKILSLNLSKGTINEETIGDRVYEEYLSGMGLAAHILYDRIPAGADPLGPDNVLGFVTGLLTGTGSLFTGRWTVVGKSPLTGCWGDANCGGNLSPAIKRAGYDGIFFSGISPKPVLLHIKNGKAELKDASHIWGKDTVETEEALKKEYGEHVGIATIGPAGENLSLISGIANERGRMAARSGLGAVMGSKKLKAVVIEGKKRIPVHDSAAMHRLSQKCNKWVQFDIPLVPGPALGWAGALLRILPTGVAMDGYAYKLMLRKWGTGAMNRMSAEWGDSPIKNWKGSNEDWNMKKSKSTDPDLIKKHETVKYHCYSCPLGCGGICKFDGKFGETHKPEYETILALGGLLLNQDTNSLFYLNELLNRAGMDTISAGAAAAFAMECYEKKILTKEDTGGIDLTWGNTKGIIELIHKMVTREGVGDLLADGVKVASRKIGKGSSEFAVHAGGQEPAMHDSRMDPGFAVHYSVEPSPGRHTIGAQLYYEMFRLWTTIDGIPKRFSFQPYTKNGRYKVTKERALESALCSKYMNIVNSVGMCLFGAFLGSSRTPIFSWLNAATGWNKTPEEYMKIGERIQTLKQAFNIKHGIDPWANKITDRALGRTPMQRGANKGRSVEVEQMMSDYWDQFGWDPKTGKPTEEGMKKLGIYRI
jgi:aldehyde:ferredoxin oxidoreductase